MTSVPLGEDWPELREATGRICAGYPAEYWRRLEDEHGYPTEFIRDLTEAGFLGALIPEAYGGGGLPLRAAAVILETINRHGCTASQGHAQMYIMGTLLRHGSEAQKRQFLPRIAAGELRLQAFGVTEPTSGTDTLSLKTTAKRDGDHYVVNGSKMFITNARTATIYSLVVKTDPTADPPHKGISLFAAERGPGITVSRDIEKIGYKSIETCEVTFEDYRVPAANLIGGTEGRGLQTVLSGLEVGRINIASRAVGVAQAAFESAIRYAQERTTFGKPICEHQAIQLKLADMATKIEASRLLVQRAAEMKDRGERCDLEAGMAKLFASETCQEVALEAMRVLGGYGYTKEFPVERYYRDAPLMLIGEGTNEIQRLVIARSLVQKYKV
jgi:alkylation response protein AidB-like acyl-CoA dehydrogenase